MKFKSAFWNWVVTHAQIIQNVDMHLACLEMRVARMNFDLILLPTSYAVWLRLPLPRYNDRRLNIEWNLDEDETWQHGPTHWTADL